MISTLVRTPEILHLKHEMQSSATATAEEGLSSMVNPFNVHKVHFSVPHITRFAERNKLRLWSEYLNTAQSKHGEQ